MPKSQDQLDEEKAFQASHNPKFPGLAGVKKTAPSEASPEKPGTSKPASTPKA